MKKIFILTIPILLLIVTALFLFKLKPFSKKEKTIIKIPIGEVSKYKLDKTKLDILEGTVFQLVHNPEVENPLKSVVVKTNGEMIILGNEPYVNVLKQEYLGKLVKLYGKWRKNTVIFNKEFKQFWIEDIDVVNKTEGSEVSK